MARGCADGGEGGREGRNEKGTGTTDTFAGSIATANGSPTFIIAAFLHPLKDSTLKV